MWTLCRLVQMTGMHLSHHPEKPGCTEMSFCTLWITLYKPSRMQDLPMCISPYSAGVTTGADCLPLPCTETWGRCPGMASSNSSIDLPVLETRQGSRWCLSADSSHQLLKPRGILHPYHSYMPGLSSAVRRCM